ncbi:MAG: Fe-S protein assembly chaperone HscA [Burkholderiales bacterium]
MALLQISEPGLSAAPHQHRLAVGIDLGTTNSLVASVISGSGAVIRDEDGHSLLPSVVRYLADGEIETGHSALAQQSGDALNTIASAKRLMGRSLADVTDAHQIPYRLVDSPGMVAIDTAAGIKTPVEVGAEILKTLRLRAEAALGGELTGAVITVPAYFDDAQRQATKDAARLAGLTVLRLLNEPTAAAIAYGLDNAAEGIYAVYDLGGGTFDISILNLARGIFEVLATNGDSALGGDDFDRAIAGWLSEQLALPPLDAQDMQQLLTHARAAKEALSIDSVAHINVTLGYGRIIDALLSREVFETMTSELVARTLKPTRKALRDAGLKIEDVKGVVLVGGSTRMPHVRHAVAEYFRQTPLTNVDPDQVVALGAAMQANVLAGNRGNDDWLLLDINPLSLGIETMGGLVEKIIPRNAAIPVAQAQEFTTFKDGQTAMSFHVLQGERELVADCRSLARFELRGIPPMVAGAARIRVTLQVDADGLLSVSAREQSTGVETSVVVKPSYGLNDAQIATMLQDAYGKADSDMQIRMLREAQVDARRLLDATAAAMRQDGQALLSPAEHAALTHAMHQLAEVIETGDSESLKPLKQASEALNQATRDFAARRMDASIQRALTGHKLQDLERRA